LDTTVWRFDGQQEHRARLNPTIASSSLHEEDGATMLVSDIMATAVEFAAPDDTIQEAAALMGELDVGALPVGAADDLQGVLTDRDILFRVVAEGRDNAALRVREVMSRRVFTCSPQ
jgi:CBS domain-containing protein